MYVCGDVAGEFKDRNVQLWQIATIKDCEERCNLDHNCIGFEYGASDAVCNLNYCCPNNGNLNKNYQFCYVNEVKYN